MIQAPEYSKLPDVFYQQIPPTPVASPEWILFNEDLCNEIGASPETLKIQLPVFSGNSTFEGIPPLAQAYAGHQFGHFTLLGDGRAHLIGEWKDSKGHLWEVHLKGSGPTKFSRGGDGRAALGPMIREYLISEALHALGVPSTRSLGVIATGDTTYRETPLPGAIVVRMASSHLRVGTFEYAATLNETKETKTLLDFAIQRHDPDLKDSDTRALDFLKRVIDRQARLVAQWMSVGFVHGVMNTDNMTISGETIDYGPCAFMDTYDAATVFSSIDRNGRYAYGQQPAMAQWNLTRLAETLLPLISPSLETGKEKAATALNDFPQIFESHYFSLLRNKLGLNSESESDKKLFEALFRWLYQDKQDMTTSFISLTESHLRDFQNHPSELFQNFCGLWIKALEHQKTSLAEAQENMRKVNPVIIPRNHKVEHALNAAENGDLSLTLKLLDALRHPYSRDDRFLEYRNPLEGHSKTYQTFCGT